MLESFGITKPLCEKMKNLLSPNVSSNENQVYVEKRCFHEILPNKCESKFRESNTFTK